MEGVVMGKPSGPYVRAGLSPLRAVYAYADEGDHVVALARALDRVSAPVVVVRHATAYFPDDDGLWEAMKLFEFHSDVSLVCGRIVDRSDKIVAGGES